MRVETAQENADRGSEEIRDNLGFLQTFLLVFAFIAVFVGAFLIFNTFSITVAQRVTEFGMLRTLGASRRQILTTVAGRGAGDRPARGAGRDRRRLPRSRCCSTPCFEAFGIDLPTTGLVLESRTVVVSLLVGVVVTLVSSLVPALRSTRVPPIAALHAFAPPPTPAPPARSTWRSRSLLGARPAWRWSCSASSAAAAPATAAGLMGGGAVAIVLAVSLFSPRLVPPLAAVAGWPLERLRRLTGRLARENAQRNPSRTAVTAAALMIGLALVAFVTVFAAGLKSSVAQVVDENFAGGLVIQNSDGFSPIPDGAADGGAQGARASKSVATIRSAAGEAASAAARRPRSRRRPATSARRVDDRMEAGRAGDAARPRATARRSSPTPSPPTTASKLGDRFRLLSQTGAQAELPSRRRVRLQARRLRQRPRSPSR